ncbi:MAG: tryptophan synthase subunit alpha [Victivallaceae bacterium]
MNRIQKTFAQCRQENRKALVAFVTAGNPDLKTSQRLVEEIIAAGADIIELGVPFSDPMADGPVIQESSRRALLAGTCLKDIIPMAADIRRKSNAPIILFSYYNVILAYGLEKLAQDCVAAGIDGWLVVDVPLEERYEILPLLKSHGLSLIPLVAPTTPPERAQKIVQDADGFVYYITVKGVTGARQQIASDLAEKLSELRKLSPVPVVAGFGISTPENAAATAAHADGIVVGSALVRIMNDTANPEEGINKSRELVKLLAGALKNS